MATVRYYSSNMAGAPVLGGIGTFTTVFDACLVTGFGDQPPAGFSKTPIATNISVYQSDDLAGCRLCYALDDSWGTAAVLTGYETLIGSTLAGWGWSIYCYRLASAIPWRLYSDGRIVYFFADTTRDGTWGFGLTFGDIISYMENDQYCGILIGGDSQMGGNNFYRLGNGTGSRIARNHLQIAESHTSVARYSHGLCSNLGTATEQSFPNPVTGLPYVWPVDVWQGSPNTAARGLLPGVWCPVHKGTAAIPQDTELTGLPELPGRTLVLQKCSSTHRVAIDITGPWRDDGLLGIAGTITELFVPGSYQVCLFRQSDMQLLKTTWSAADGSYSFTGLADQSYVVMALDHTSPLRPPAVQDNVVPS